ncbi:hypothetical protein TNIN_52891, partial [Trichonephila inaurata madagascariensis]
MILLTKSFLSQWIRTSSHGKRIQSLLLIIFIASSSHGLSNLVLKAFCDESLFNEMEAIEKKLPPKLAKESVKCVVTNSTKEGGDLDFECNITKVEEARKYARLFENSIL